MYLEKFRIQNIKCFHEQTIHFQKRKNGNNSPDKQRDQSNWNVILGANGDGKSTLLRCIAACLLDQGVASRMLDLENLVRHQRGEGSLELTIIGEEGDVVPNGRRRNLTAYYSVVQGGMSFGNDEDEESNTSTRIFEPDPLHKELAANIPGSVEDLKKDKNFLNKHVYPDQERHGWVSCGYGPFRRHKGHSTFLDRVNKKLEKRFLTLFYEGAALLECETWLKDMERRALKAGADSDAHRAFENVLSILCDPLLPEVTAIELDDEVLFKWRGKKMNLEQMSDGYRIMFLLLTDMLRWLETMRPAGTAIRDVSGVVFIDEVDAHLHPEWQRKIGFSLVDMFPNIQFIVTTHSPFVVMAAGENSLTMLHKTEDDAGQDMVVADRVPFLRGQAVDRILTENFGLSFLRDSFTEREIERYEQLLSKQYSDKKISDAEMKDLKDLETQLNRRLQDDPLAPRNLDLIWDLEYFSKQIGRPKKPDA